MRSPGRRPACWLTLSPEGVITGRTTALFGEVSQTAITSARDRSLIGQFIRVVQCVHPSFGASVRDDVAGRTDGSAQLQVSDSVVGRSADRATQPATVPTKSLSTLCLWKTGAAADDVHLNIDTGGGLTASSHVKVHNLPENGRVFALITST
jgi:hypothetical protein